MASEIVTVAGWIDVDPTARDGLVAASVALQRSTRDDEPGCEAYVFTIDPAVEGRIHVYEQWSTAADLDAHFLHPNFAAMRELLREYPRVGSQTSKLRVDAVGPVYGPDKVPSATYWPDQPD